MEPYVKKSVLVAEMKRLENNEFLCDSYDEATGFQSALRMVKEFIDTLEIKEVDLEDDVDKILEANNWNFDKIDFYQFAKHFFELGLKAQKRSKV